MARCLNCGVAVTGEDVDSGTCPYCGVAVGAIGGDTGAQILDAVTGVGSTIDSFASAVTSELRSSGAATSSRKLVLGEVDAGEHSGAMLTWDGSLGAGGQYALESHGVLSQVSDKVAAGVLESDSVKFTALDKAHFICGSCGLRYHPTRSAAVSCGPMCPRCTVAQWEAQTHGKRLQRDKDKHSNAVAEFDKARRDLKKLEKKCPSRMEILSAPWRLMTSTIQTVAASLLGVLLAVILIPTGGTGSLFGFLIVASPVAFGLWYYLTRMSSWTKKIRRARRVEGEAEAKAKGAESLWQIRKDEAAEDLSGAQQMRGEIPSVAGAVLDKAAERLEWRCAIGSTETIASDVDAARGVLSRVGRVTVSAFCDELGWNRIRAREVLEALAHSKEVRPHEGHPWVRK